MRPTFLIQRLDPPRTTTIFGADNPFSFGGGLRNGGLSSEAMDLLRDVWSFDYMGSAEFEFGAVPEALQRIAGHAEAGTLEAFTHEIALTSVRKPWRGDVRKVTATDTAPVFVLAPKEWRDEVIAVIEQVAAGETRLKEAAMLDRALRPDGDDYQPDVCGWLELDNGFLFFTDRAMWSTTAALFGVGVV